MDMYESFKLHASIEAAYHHVISLQQMLIDDYCEMMNEQWETDPDRYRKTKVIVDDLRRCNEYLHTQANAADTLCDGIAAQIERNQRKAGEQAASEALTEILSKYPQVGKEQTDGKDNDESEGGDGDPR